MKYLSSPRIAVDIGGTFTDICVLNETTGEMRVAKTSSTPDDPMQGAMNAVHPINLIAPMLRGVYSDDEVRRAAEKQ